MREAGVPSRRDEGSIYTRKIRVLLVDHNKDWLVSTANVLDACAYNVTAVEHAKTALLVLSERKDDIDLVIVDIDIPDLDALTLLRLAVNMDLLAILMSANEDDMMIKRAIEIGAFLMIEKPVTKEALKYLWQDVMWQRTIRKDIKYGEKDKRLSQMSIMDENLKRDDESNGKPSKEDKGSETSDKHNHGASTKTFKSRKSSRKDDQGNNNNNGGRVKRKVCTEWTDELHSKFMDAVGQLGEGRCYPKEILEHMKVPGLTRMQVASHLQKCRNDNWRAPEERRSHPPCAPPSSKHNNNNDNNNNYPQQKSGPRKFGLMPHLLKKPNNAQPRLHEGPEIHPSMEMEQHINPQPYFDPQQYGFGSQSFAQNFTVENMQQLGASNGAYNTIDQLDMSNVNSLQKFATLSDLTYHQALDPILPDFSSARFGRTSYVDSSSQRQPPTETFGFFSELDAFAQNYPTFAEGSLINQSLKARNPVVDFEGYSERLPVAPNTETKGEWMPETSNIFGES